jgi:hypothetical protein
VSPLMILVAIESLNCRNRPAEPARLRGGKQGESAHS